MDAVDPYIAAGATQTPTPPQPGEVDPFISAGATEADPYKDAGATAVPPLSEQDFQDKLKTRWGPILTGQSIGAPADFAEMQASGKFTPEQLQRAQTDSQLRTTYIQQQAEGFGDKAKEAWEATKSGLGSMAQDVLVVPRLAQAAGELSVTKPDVMTGANQVASSALEGGSEAATGILGLGKGLITGPAAYIKNAYDYYTGKHLTPKQAEDEYQAWKLDYINTHPVPGFAPPSATSRMQDLQASAGHPAEEFAPPVAPLTSLASTAATLPLFAGVGKIAETVIPKALAATGAAEALPNLSKAISPSGAGVANATKLRDTMTAALEGATPEGGNAGLAANIAAKTGSAVSAGGRAASAIGAIPRNFTQWAAEKLTGSPDLGEKLLDSGLLTKATLGAAAIFGLGPVASVIGVVKGLEAVGAVGEGLGDFITRLATADPTNPYGRFMALAADSTAPPWMRQVAQSPAVQAVLKAGTFGAGAAKGFAKGAATGAAISTISGDNPQETGGNIAGMGLFGALHGGMAARDSNIFQAHLGAVTKFISGHLDAGGSPDTLRLVPADQILQAALLKNVLPDVQVRFATAQDAGSPFAKGGTAENQAGLYNSQNKTIWIDPTKRAPGATLLHEAFHPIFDNLVSQQGGIKDALDQALAADGRSIDDFKKQYADAAFPGNPQAAADYITSQDAGNPNWAYSELLSESAAHQLSGQDLLEAANGKAVAQSATQAALGGLDGWLSAQGVEWKKTLSGVVFPDFQNVFNSPETRRLAYKLAQAQRQTVLGKAQPESTGRGLTAADMGKAPAPYYQGPNKENFNAYGREITDPTGKTTFKPWPASELRKRAKAEAIARQKYFPVGQKITSMPAGLEADPDIAPWTKKALKEIFDSSQSKSKLSMWYHRLNNENSATSDRGWAADVRRSLGNVQVSYQSGKPVSVEMTKKGNLITHWESEEAENQKLSDWANRHGDLSLDLWGGDQAKAKADIQTYLENHATGQPGESNGIGTAKRDVINAMLAGGNKEFEDKNPLRAKLKDRDRAGIMRSLRVDRMESATPEPSDRAPSDWEKLKRNLSPREPLQFSPKAKEDYKLDKAYDYWLDKEGKLHAAPEGHAEWAVKNIKGLKEKLSDTGNPDADALVNMRSIYGNMFKAGNLRLTREEGRVNVDFRNITPTKAQKAALENVSLHRGEPVVDDNGETYVDFSGQLQFSPSEGPKAIASAAVRDEDTGKIYPGSDHDSAARKAPTGRASNLIDGYVTNDGEFLDRDTAFKRAVAQKQYKPSDEDYNVNKILYGLTSERYNKQNPNTAYGVAKAETALGTNKAAKEKTPDYAKMDAEWKAKQEQKSKKVPVADTTSYPEDIDDMSRRLLRRAIVRANGLVTTLGGEPLENKVVGSVLTRRNPKDIDIAVRVRDIAPFIGKKVPGAMDNMEGGFPVDTFLTDGKRWVASVSTKDGAEFQEIVPKKRLASTFSKRQRAYSPAAEPSKRTPDETVRKQAADYAKEQGIDKAPFTGYAPLNEDLGKRVADAYEAAQHIPDDPKVKAAYASLAKETRAQWDYLTKQGVKFEPWTQAGQPYKDSAAMRADVQGNKHLWFFPTEGGFGKGEESTNNPMLAPTGITEDGKSLVVNDLFRAVHDYFGHAKEGYEFDPRGEYNAFLAHSRMFSDAALPALTSETMGQNSWVNFGKHLRDKAGNIPKKGEPGFVAPQERPFADQKATVLPEDLQRESAGASTRGAFSPSAAEDFFERREAELNDLAKSLKASQGKGTVSWKKIPATQLRKVWLQYGKTGHIDAEGLATIADKMLTNIARLRASTDMMGHAQVDVRPELEDMGHVFSDKEWEEWMPEHFTDKDGAWVISDYGLPKLEELYSKIFDAETAEDKLFAIDQALNVVHQRSDLANLFVQGGTRTLQAIADQGGYTTPGTFSPTPRENLTSAAIRVDKEHVFTSDSHFGAFTKALKSGLVTEDDAWGPRQEDGFMTTAGRFVPRQEGYKIAAEAQQVKDLDPHLTQNGTWLDSSNTKFTPQAGGRAGRYSPAANEKDLTSSKPGVKSGSMEDEKLSYPMEMAPGKAGGRLPGILTAPYSQKLLYQRQMLKAMAPLFEAFGVKPGATVKSSYENSAGETEHNPMTKVELPPAQAKLFALLHGHFADQEAVAGGYSETSPGNWEPSSPHAFFEKPDTTWADKINAAGPEAKALLAKLEPIIGPAVEAVNKKWEGTLNSGGDQTKTPAFKKWFGDWEDPKAFSSRRDPAKAPVSVVVKDHKPMVLYHATTGDFSEFDPTKKGVTGFGWLGQFETQRHGFFATPNPEFAHNFIEHKEGTGHNIMPLYMNLKSPMDLTKGTDDIADELKEHGVNPSWVRNVRDQWELFDGEDGKAFVAAAKKAGYDGAIIHESDTKGETQAAYIAFDKNQIKSAIGNNGKFDATNPDIRFSPGEEKTLQENSSSPEAANTAIKHAEPGEPVTISHPAELSRPAMTRWLLENKAYDSAGPLDAKAARWIASKGKTWTLTTLPTDYFESNEGITDKSHAALSQPIVAHATKDGWEVLDGQHRVKEALDNGVDKIPAYIPAEDKDQSFSPPVKTPTELELQSASSSPEHVKEAIKHAEPGAPIALGTFSPPVMDDKTFQELNGKKMLFVIGDQSNAGPHYVTAGGKKVVRMQGGPGYPNIPENQGKAGWAFASKALSTRLAKAFKNVDYMAVFVGSPDMVAGAPSFSKAYFAELKEAVEAGDVKPKALDRLAREIGRSLRKEGGERHSAGPVPVIHNFSELEHLCLGYKPIQQVLFGGEVPVTLASFGARSEIVRKLGSHANSEKFGTPSYEAIRDKFNDPGAFEQGQLAQIIRLHPDKPIGTSEKHGVANHPDYPYVIPGTGLGQPGKKLMLNDVLKPWLEAPLAAAQGGNPDYKVRMNMPQSTINPTAFEK